MDEKEYQLALDDQVGKFLDIRHKHTYFLVTAAIGVLAFSVNFSASNKLLSNIDGLSTLLSFIGVMSNLSVAGLALWSLSLDNASYALHLQYRHRSKDWKDLTPSEQKKWESINRRASSYREKAFILLTIGVFTNAMFIANQLNSKGDNQMHHYGESSTVVKSHPDHYEIIFTNKETGQEVKMIIPRTGSRSDASRGVSLTDVDMVADGVKNVLKQVLD